MEMAPNPTMSGSEIPPVAKEVYSFTDGISAIKLGLETPGDLRGTKRSFGEYMRNTSLDENGAQRLRTLLFGIQEYALADPMVAVIEARLALIQVGQITDPEGKQSAMVMLITTVNKSRERVGRVLLDKGVIEAGAVRELRNEAGRAHRLEGNNKQLDVEVPTNEENSQPSIFEQAAEVVNAKLAEISRAILSGDLVSAMGSFRLMLPTEQQNIVRGIIDLAVRQENLTILLELYKGYGARFEGFVFGAVVNSDNKSLEISFINETSGFNDYVGERA